MRTVNGEESSVPVQAHAEEFRSPGTGENAAVGVLLSHGFTGSPYSMRPFGVNVLTCFMIAIVRCTWSQKTFGV